MRSRLAVTNLYALPIPLSQMNKYPSITPSVQRISSGLILGLTAQCRIACSMQAHLRKRFENIEATGCLVHPGAFVPAARDGTGRR